MKELKRRGLLKSGLRLGFGLASARATAQICNVTPTQTEGPFYPETRADDEDTDLTVVLGRSKTALGERVLITGKVLLCGEPIPGALVEIWQACYSGRYKHSRDPNNAPLDDNFQYWGKSKSDAQGTYEFKTIKPGRYPATDQWIRPPHIHFKVFAAGIPTLTTQMYFADERELNSSDLILNNLSPEQRDMVIVDFKESELPDVKRGCFDIYLGQTPEMF